MSNIEIITNHGSIQLELYPEKAPQTVANFLRYVEEGSFNKTLFHRVIPNFMIQGGGFDTSFTQKQTLATIKNEANNGLKNKLGSVAMARTADPHSASSQFFINTSDNDFLNFSAETSQGWGYCVFGQVIEGNDTINKISALNTSSRGGHQDVPKEDVIIEKVTVLA